MKLVALAAPGSIAGASAPGAFAVERALGRRWRVVAGGLPGKARAWPEAAVDARRLYAGRLRAVPSDAVPNELTLASAGIWKSAALTAPGSQALTRTPVPAVRDERRPVHRPRDSEIRPAPSAGHKMWRLTCRG